ncbi:hypothetical protein FH972_013150 [Carpinus fangiana]|uniref:Uncharacterized protein n=1 Tax=Carpinus fangiana TaxID=176857 RepID=A0A5N6R5Y1_9ROSI|nr:hypothetical protein FH972_013150 [Carpinus fangiana]
MYSRCCLLAQSERCFGKKPCCSFCMFSGACFRALALLMMERVKAKWKKLFSSRGCLGCYTNHELIITVDEPSKGLKIQGQSVKKPSVSEDFWSTSTCEMDNSIVQSRRSISSISASNPVLDPQGCPGSVSNPSEFINHGNYRLDSIVACLISLTSDPPAQGYSAVSIFAPVFSNLKGPWAQSKFNCLEVASVPDRVQFIQSNDLHECTPLQLYRGHNEWVLRFAYVEPDKAAVAWKQKVAEPSTRPRTQNKVLNPLWEHSTCNSYNPATDQALVKRSAV